MGIPVRALALMLLLTGCVRETTRETWAGTEPTANDSAGDRVEVREVVVANDGSGEEPAEPVGLALGASPGPDPVFFRLGAGYGALGQIDLASCRRQGLPPGYLHVRVTFRHSGRVVRAAVESTVAPPREALDCIGEQLEMAMVPVFEGGDVTLSKGFFVN